MKTPRGIRNNNPLNIRRTTDEWEGESKTQRDKSFVQFKNMKWGYRAAWKILQSYYQKTHRSRGFTVQNIIRRWAPPTENDTLAYIEAVKKIGGLGGHEVFQPPYVANSYFRLSRLLAAMTCVECGIPMERVDTEAIFKGYILAFPENKRELVKMISDTNEYQDWTPYFNMQEGF